MATARTRYAPPRPRNDAYVGLLSISLLALVISCVLLYMDYSQYGAAKPPYVPRVPSGSSGVSLPSGGGDFAPSGPAPGGIAPGPMGGAGPMGPSGVPMGPMGGGFPMNPMGGGFPMNPMGPMGGAPMGGVPMGPGAAGPGAIRPGGM